MTQRFHLAELTTDEVEAICERPPTAVLVPIGSVEPHGPHLPLATDTVISETACRRAVPLLFEAGIPTYIAPSVPYGVTEFASGFSGAVSVPADVLTALLRSIVDSLFNDGWSHVCLVNNHLEPAHDEAVRAAIADLPRGRASVACPLTRRWARQLGEEFRRGNCHAGRYETSLALASGSEVRSEYADLPQIAISLSDGIKHGKRTFLEMGMQTAYTGAPSHATAAEGESLYDLLAHMIRSEITESFALASAGAR
jgi:creatinine amidohydrolase